MIDKFEGFSQLEYSTPFKLVDIEDVMKKNMLICHPDDYIKIAESGHVKLLTDGGVSVIQSTLCEVGKQIVTGALAVELNKEVK